MNIRETVFRMSYWVVGMALTIYLSGFFVAAPALYRFTWSCFAFFAIVTYLILFITHLLTRENEKANPTQILLGLISARFILAGIFIAIYILLFWTGGNEILIPFGIIYLFFTVVEIYFLNKHVQYLESQAKDRTGK